MFLMESLTLLSVEWCMTGSAYRHWQLRSRNERQLHSPVNFNLTIHRRINLSLRPGLHKIQDLKSSSCQNPSRHLYVLRAPLDRILVGIRAQGLLRHGPDRQVAGRMSMGGAISVQLVSVHRQRIHFRARQEPAVNSK